MIDCNRNVRVLFWSAGISTGGGIGAWLKAIIMSKKQVMSQISHLTKAMIQKAAAALSVPLNGYKQWRISLTWLQGRHKQGSVADWVERVRRIAKGNLWIFTRAGKTFHIL